MNDLLATFYLAARTVRDGGPKRDRANCPSQGMGRPNPHCRRERQSALNKTEQDGFWLMEQMEREAPTLRELASVQTLRDLGATV